MRLSDFDFDLPEDRIALRPAEPRDAARLLVVRPGQDLADHVVRELPDFLRPGDAMVFNDTRVIPARLAGLREGRTTGARKASIRSRSILITAARPSGSLSPRQAMMRGSATIPNMT